MQKIKRLTPREVNFEKGINPYALGSVIASFGNTKVHVTATVEEGVPRFLKGKGEGWVTAEYSMLPGSTHSRIRRERSKVGGRTQEIQRLIGRSLRAIVDMKKLGERQIIIDCDVLVADGGTRTTSISGAYVALKMAVDKLIASGDITESPLTDQLGAISIGIDKENNVIADLNYEEDSTCNTDMNVVMTASGKFIEIQGTAEGNPFSREELNAMLECAESALEVVFEKQNKAL